MTFEGVVCKAIKGSRIVMFKMKNEAWLKKLRLHCDGNSQLFKKLE
jgi:hypothetical protein